MTYVRRIRLDDCRCMLMVLPQSLELTARPALFDIMNMTVKGTKTLKNVRCTKPISDINDAKIEINDII